MNFPRGDIENQRFFEKFCKNFHIFTFWVLNYSLVRYIMFLR